jgi:hypothetical protein
MKYFNAIVFVVAILSIGYASEEIFETMSDQLRAERNSQWKEASWTDKLKLVLQVDAISNFLSSWGMAGDNEHQQDNFQQYYETVQVTNVKYITKVLHTVTHSIGNTMQTDSALSEPLHPREPDLPSPSNFEPLRDPHVSVPTLSPVSIASPNVPQGPEIASDQTSIETHTRDQDHE